MNAHVNDIELQAALARSLSDTESHDIAAGVGLQAARQAAQWAVLLERPRDALRAEAWACIHLMRLGRHEQMLEEARAVLPRLSPADAGELLPLRSELLRCITLSAAEMGVFDVALDAAHELSRASHGSSDPAAPLNAAYGLALCLERMGDSWQAVRTLNQALAAATGSEAPRALMVAANAVCAVSIGMAHRLRDTGADTELQEVLANARRHADMAMELLAQVSDPTYEVAVPGNLGEVRLLQGEVGPAWPLLDKALARAQARGLRAHAWRVRTSMADWLLAAGQPEAARDAALELLKEMGSAAPQQTAIRAHDTVYRACRALGDAPLALQHLEGAERMDRQRTTAQLRAQSQLFVTRAEAQHARAMAAEFAAEAERDPLTGLGNRRHLERRCAQLMPQAELNQSPLTLAVLDVDHFKRVNDQHGHTVGDVVLVAMAQLLRENTRTGDVVARHGGEEFVIVLPGMPASRAQEVCERLRERVQTFPWALRCGTAAPLTVSLGLAAAPSYELPDLLHRADRALYRAKGEGRNRVALALAA
jgi:diguanylate cyclase (GGDEF)-like protein